MKTLVSEFAEIFKEELGTIKGTHAKIFVKESAVPKAFTARRVPFPLRKPVEVELARLVKEGVVEPVDPSSTPIEWSTPTVNVDKGNGSVRICGDFRVTLNSCLIEEHHVMPTFDDLTSKLVGGEEFSVVDLRDAYLQMEVDEADRKYLVIATHMGYFRYKRLPFGLSSSPAIFQRFMERLLRGLPHVGVMLDDVIVTGPNRQIHLKILKQVLDRLRNAGLKAKFKKCQFLRKSVRYLGYTIDRKGVHPTTEKLEAIALAPSPKNVKELRAFLGAINFYERFIPNLHGLCSKLHQLTGKRVPWRWTEVEEREFNNIKKKLSAENTLVLYDEEKPLIIACDASEVGLGAVLMHKFPEGSHRPIAYASRTLSKAEKNYAPIDKEALALVFAVKKFHQFIYGRKFTLATDHKPLTRIFGNHRDLPKVTNNRLVRWAIILMGYNYDIVHWKGSDNCCADGLSRLPMNGAPNEEEGHIANLRMDKLEVVTTYDRIKDLTSKDPVLSQIRRWIENGWPTEPKPGESSSIYSYTEFWKKRDELALEDDIVMWGNRIVVPEKLKEKVLKILHEGHPGVAAMRALARYYVWWPRVDQDVERFVKQCNPCQENRDDQCEVPLYPWNVPERPWDRIHLDFAGPMDGRQWLLGVDAFSKWVEVEPMVSTTSGALINRLRVWFSRYGIPKQIVTDNGPQFSSAEFNTFCKDNNIRHISSTPYHPKTNGLVERMVKTVKSRYKACRKEGVEPLLALQRVLLTYRNTPQKTTGRPPAVLFMGRRLPTLLDRCRPDPKGDSEWKIWKQKIYHDRRVRERVFEEGDDVWVKKEIGPGWYPGTIEERTGELSYTVRVGGEIKRKHADNLRRREGALQELGRSEEPDEQGSLSEQVAGAEQPQPRRSARLASSKTAQGEV